MAFTIFKDTTTFDFVGKRRFAYAFSIALVLLGLVGIFMSGGLRYGVDFAGGVMVQLQFEKPVEDAVVKTAMADIDLPGLIVQNMGANDREYMLRFSAAAEVDATVLRAQVTAALEQALPNNPAAIERLEMVGPKVGGDLRNMAVEALYYSVLLITVYISGRFEYNWLAAAAMAGVMWAVVWGVGWLGFSKVYGVGIAMLITVLITWKLKLNFALGTIVSLLHDVFTTISILMLLGKEIDLNIIAAILAIVGYSLNDTIIIFDRIRENLKKIPPDTPEDKMPSMYSLINLSVNQTLSRTLLTSGTTLVTCLSLYLLGGSVIHDFALTILIGVVLGTYSSIAVASPILLAFGDVGMYRKSQSESKKYERPGEHGVV